MIASHALFPFLEIYSLDRLLDSGLIPSTLEKPPVEHQLSPYTGIVAPCISLAVSEARNMITPASESGCTHRL